MDESVFRLFDFLKKLKKPSITKTYFEHGEENFKRRRIRIS